MKTTGNDTHQNCSDKKKYGFMNDLFLLLVWFSYSECLTGEGLGVESRCVYRCALDMESENEQWCDQPTLIIRQL